VVPVVVVIVTVVIVTVEVVPWVVVTVVCVIVAARGSVVVMIVVVHLTLSHVQPLMLHFSWMYLPTPHAGSQGQTVALHTPVKPIAAA